MDIDLTEATAEELAALALAVEAEQDRRRLIEELPAEIEATVLRWQFLVGETDGAPWEPPTGAHNAVRPGGSRTFPDGTTWKNISGTWLAHGPDEYPRGWEIIDPAPDPDNPDAWDPLKTYSKPPGATVTHKGVVYDLTFAVATPGQEPGDPVMWAVWKARP